MPSIAGWTTTFALSQDYTFGAAVNLTAGFFACFFTGRILAAGFAARARPGALVIGAIAGVTLLMSFAVGSRAALDRLDRTDEEILNDILRHAIKGPAIPFPATKTALRSHPMKED